MSWDTLAGCVYMQALACYPRREGWGGRGSEGTLLVREKLSLFVCLSDRLMTIKHEISGLASRTTEHISLFYPFVGGEKGSVWSICVETMGMIESVGGWLVCVFVQQGGFRGLFVIPTIHLDSSHQLLDGTYALFLRSEPS